MADVMQMRLGYVPEMTLMSLSFPHDIEALWTAKTAVTMWSVTCEKDCAGLSGPAQSQPDDKPPSGVCDRLSQQAGKPERHEKGSLNGAAKPRPARLFRGCRLCQQPQAGHCGLPDHVHINRLLLANSMCSRHVFFANLRYIDSAKPKYRRMWFSTKTKAGLSFALPLRAPPSPCILAPQALPG